MKILLSLHHRPEEYRVKLSIYNGDGKLVDARTYNGVKQVVLRTCEARVSRQVAASPVVLMIDAEEPHVELREGGILVVEDKKCRQS